MGRTPPPACDRLFGGAFMRRDSLCWSGRRVGLCGGSVGLPQQADRCAAPRLRPYHPLRYRNRMRQKHAVISVAEPRRRRMRLCAAPPVPYAGRQPARGKRLLQPMTIGQRNDH